MDTLTEQERETPPSMREPPPPPVRTGKRRLVLIIIGLAVLALAFFVVRGVHHRPQRAAFQRGGFGPPPPGGFRGGFGRPASDANEVVSVAVARAALGNIVIRLPALGTVTPVATVTVQTQISGYLQTVGFTEGQLVRKGQFLAQIDPRPYQAALDQAKGNLARDEAQLADDQLDLKRYADLIKQDAVSGQQLDTQKYLVAQYVGTVESDKAAVEAAAVNLAYCHIVSPITGRVGLREVDAGNYVTPNEASGLVIVTQLQPITVIFPLAEDYVPGLQQRLAAGATLEVDAYDHNNSKELATGKLLTLDNEIDPTTGTVKLRAQFENKENTLFPNQFVNIQLVENVLEHQLIIPDSAVRRGAPNGVLSTFVYIVNPNHTVSVRPVALGEIDGDNVAVKSGLEVGDLVVTEGADRLRDGARVSLPSRNS